MCPSFRVSRTILVSSAVRQRRVSLLSPRHHQHYSVTTWWSARQDVTTNTRHQDPGTTSQTFCSFAKISQIFGKVNTFNLKIKSKIYLLNDQSSKLAKIDFPNFSHSNSYLNCEDRRIDNRQEPGLPQLLYCETVSRSFIRKNH